MADDDDQLVTKRDLNAGLHQLGDELRGEMQAMERRLVDGLRGEMHAMEHRMVLEIGGIVQRALGIATEQSRNDFKLLDEKYQDIPARVTALETDLAELRRRPPPAAPRPRAK